MAAKERPDFVVGDRVAGYVEFRTIKKFYRVFTPPYLVDGVWVMEVIRYDSHYEVECSKVHLVGERQPPKKPIITKENVMQNIKKFKLPLIVGAIVCVLFVIAAWLGGNYNSLVSANEDVDNAWSKVETQYQRRFDLIGNVVESVKGSQLQEQKVFGDIANARKQYQSAGTADEKAAAASSIETNVALIPRLQEAYPELKSNENIQKLMAELGATENQISAVRDKYNDTVTNYNKNVQRFPKNVFAGLFGYKERKQFQATSGAEKAPTVNFTR